MKVFLLSLTLSFVAAAAGGAYLVWEHHPDRVLIERVMDDHYQTFRQVRQDDESKNYISQYLEKLQAKRKVKEVAYARTRRHAQKAVVAAQSASLVFDNPASNDPKYTRQVAGKGRRKVKAPRLSAKHKKRAHKKKH